MVAKKYFYLLCCSSLIFAGDVRIKRAAQPSRAMPQKFAQPQRMQAEQFNFNVEPFAMATQYPDESLFQEVKTNPQEAARLIAFWGRQMTEHALFLHLLLEDEGSVLKKRALGVHKKWDRAMKTFSNDPSMASMNEILPLLKELLDFKTELLEVLLSGKWIGWAWPLFVDHVKLEGIRFAYLLNGLRLSPEVEIGFWDRTLGDHAGMGGQLWDPTQFELVDEALKTYAQFRTIARSEREMFLMLTLQSSKALDKYLRKGRKASKANQVKSIIHPVLLDHVIREGEEGIRSLEKLAQQRPELRERLKEKQAEFSAESEYTTPVQKRRGRIIGEVE